MKKKKTAASYRKKTAAKKKPAPPASRSVAKKATGPAAVMKFFRELFGLSESAVRAAKPKNEDANDVDKKFPKPKGVGVVPGASSDSYDEEPDTDIIYPFSDGSKKPTFKGWNLWLDIFRQNPHVSACVRLIAGAMMAGGWRIVPAVEGGTVSPVSQAILEDFFSTPHPYYTFEELFRGEFENLVLASRNYTEIGYNELDQPAALYALPQGTIWPNIDKRGLFEDESRAFVQKVKGTEPIYFPWPKMLWLRMPGVRFNSVNPASPIELLIAPSTSVIESQNFVNSYYRSGGKMGLVVINRTWTKAQAIEMMKYFKRHYTNSANGHQILVVYDDTEVMPPPKGNNDFAQVINVQQFEGRKTSGVFEVDPRMIGFPGEGNLGGKGEREQLMQEFHIHNVNPKKDLVSKLITKQIVQQGFRIFDARFEFIPFTSKLDAESKRILAETYESMERSGLLNTGRLEDLQHARKKIDDDIPDVTPEEIKEWPTAASRNPAANISGFTVGVEKGLVSPDSLDDANLMRTRISKDLKPLTEGTLKEFRQKALVSQAMASAPSMLAPVLPQLTGLDIPAPDAPAQQPPPPAQLPPAAPPSADAEEEDEAPQAERAAAEAEMLDAWAAAVAAPLADRVGASLAKNRERLVEALAAPSPLQAAKKMIGVPGEGNLYQEFKKAARAFFLASYQAAADEISAAGDARGLVAERKTLTGGIDDYIDLLAENEFDQLYADLTSAQKRIFQQAVRDEWDTNALVAKLTTVSDYATNVLNSIVRTSATDFYNQAKLAAATDSGVVTHFTYSAIDDDRVTVICKTLDGVRVGLADKRLKIICPPNHWRCRCSLEYGYGDYTTDEAKLAAGIALIQPGFETGGNVPTVAGAEGEGEGEDDEPPAAAPIAAPVVTPEPAPTPAPVAALAVPAPEPAPTPAPVAALALPPPAWKSMPAILGKVPKPPKPPPKPKLPKPVPAPPAPAVAAPAAPLPPAVVALAPTPPPHTKVPPAVAALATPPPVKPAAPPAPKVTPPAPPKPPQPPAVKVATSTVPLAPSKPPPAPPSKPPLKKLFDAVVPVAKQNTGYREGGDVTGDPNWTMNNEYKLRDALLKSQDDTWKKTLSEAERSAALNYTDHHYGTINRAIGIARGRKADVADKAMAVKAKTLHGVIDQLTSALSKGALAEELTLYKYIDLDRFKLTAADLPRMEGLELTDFAFGSTAFNNKVDGTDAGSIGSYRPLFRIRAPKGTPGLVLDKDRSVNSGEFEFLLQRGAKYRVVGVTVATVRGSKKTVIDVDLIGFDMTRAVGRADDSLLTPLTDTYDRFEFDPDCCELVFAK